MAPEFSQQIYLQMLNNEFAVGDYMQFNGNRLSVSYDGRESMITLLEALNLQKKYKLDTLYLALSLCDRFLVNLSIENV